LTERGGKEKKHANANLVQLLARISKFMIYRKKFRGRINALWFLRLFFRTEILP
jgi:hypothetical protein